MEFKKSFINKNRWNFSGVSPVFCFKVFMKYALSKKIIFIGNFCE